MVGTSDAKFVGVDWGKRGWFSVAFNAGGGYQFGFGSFGALVDCYASASLVLVDIPIGLAPGRQEWRACDQAAKRLLEGRGSSVFLTPPRYVVEAAREAKARASTGSEFRRALASLNIPRPKGTKFSSQAWNITPMVAEVDEVVVARAASRAPEVREVHPEICFWALNGKRAMADSKKNTQGQQERVRVLERFELRTRDILCHALRDHGQHAAADDVLDALAAAVTAREGYPDNLQTIPDKPPRDSHGLPMEMVFYNPTP